MRACSPFARRQTRFVKWLHCLRRSRYFRARGPHISYRPFVLARIGPFPGYLRREICCHGEMLALDSCGASPRALRWKSIKPDFADHAAGGDDQSRDTVCTRPAINCWRTATSLSGGGKKARRAIGSSWASGRIEARLWENVGAQICRRNLFRTLPVERAHTANFVRLVCLVNMPSASNAAIVIALEKYSIGFRLGRVFTQAQAETAVASTGVHVLIGPQSGF